MAGLADDWAETGRPASMFCALTCACPMTQTQATGAPRRDRAAYRATREVRHTIIRLICAHLRPHVDPEKSWQGLNLDFTSVVFDGGNFSEAQFSGGDVSFGGAEFLRRQRRLQPGQVLRRRRRLQRRQVLRRRRRLQRR